MPPEFRSFSKIPRYSREVIVTEKIDGTNGVVYVPNDPSESIIPGSRTRWLVNGDDNHGFARWVYEYQNELREGLGPGAHFGEWWGQGIQRNYGLDHKRFSLFNVSRWTEETKPKCCHVVPTLWTGNFGKLDIGELISQLSTRGSVAAPGFMEPEGIVIFHTAASVMFKKTLERDEKPKWAGAIPI